MAVNMYLSLYLVLLFYVHLELVASVPVQKVITNHCDGENCKIIIQYHDITKDLTLKTGSNDSVLSALLDITIAHDGNSDQNDLVNLLGKVIAMLSSMMQTQQDNQQLLNNITTHDQGPMQDCSTAPSTGQYIISPSNEINPLLVVCDVDTTSGGWIVIHRRFDGSVDFDRNWVDYENGFGSLDGEFWLGLSKMHTITSHGTWKLRFDLEDFSGNHAYAEYDFFQVGSSASNYRLIIALYSGDAGDAVTGHHDLNGMAFTTKDRDNDKSDDGNCAIIHRGAWWHRGCTHLLVTGLYLGQGVFDSKGMVWYEWKNNYELLKKTEMMIKRID